MKVKVVRKFNDLKENTTREIGDEFIVSKSRFQEIQKAGDFVVEIEEVEEEVKEVKKVKEVKEVKEDLKKDAAKKNTKK